MRLRSNLEKRVAAVPVGQHMADQERGNQGMATHCASSGSVGLGLATQMHPDTLQQYGSSSGY